MADLLAVALPLADAATEGKKVITAMLIVGLIFAAVPTLGELYSTSGTTATAACRTRGPRPRVSLGHPSFVSRHP